MAVAKSCLRKLLWWRGEHCLNSPAINVNLGWRGARATQAGLPTLPPPSLPRSSTSTQLVLPGSALRCEPPLAFQPSHHALAPHLLACPMPQLFALLHLYLHSSAPVSILSSQLLVAESQRSPPLLEAPFFLQASTLAGFNRAEKSVFSPARAPQRWTGRCGALLTEWPGPYSRSRSSLSCPGRRCP